LGQREKSKLSLVISFCDVDLEWVAQLAGTFSYQEVTIYSKCSFTWGENDLPKGIITVVNLPNVGRCDHSYAYWISNMHQQLSMENDDDHVVVFLKDSFDRKMKMFRRRSLSSMIRIVVTVGFACIQVPGKRWRSVFHRT
jgi:hypothetical protein